MADPLAAAALLVAMLAVLFGAWNPDGIALALDAILTEIAPPGYSEHHSGRAIDIASAGSPPMTQDFEQTPAFAWLSANAGRFGFVMSFPRGNPYGYVFEPWHWCYHAALA